MQRADPRSTLGVVCVTAHHVEGISFAGLDVHKKSINVALLKPRARKPMQWQQANDARSVKRLVRKLKREGGKNVRCCYEAGPCGFGLQRTLRSRASSARSSRRR